MTPKEKKLDEAIRRTLDNPFKALNMTKKEDTPTEVTNVVSELSAYKTLSTHEEAPTDQATAKAQAEEDAITRQQAKAQAAHEADSKAKSQDREDAVK